MSVFEQHKAALAAIIASQEVTDAFPLDHEICSRLAALTDPRGSKARLSSSANCSVTRFSLPYSSPSAPRRTRAQPRAHRAAPVDHIWHRQVTMRSCLHECFEHALYLSAYAAESPLWRVEALVRSRSQMLSHSTTNCPLFRSVNRAALCRCIWSDAMCVHSTICSSLHLRCSL